MGRQYFNVKSIILGGNQRFHIGLNGSDRLILSEKLARVIAVFAELVGSLEPCLAVAC